MATLVGYTSGTITSGSNNNVYDIVLGTALYIPAEYAVTSVEFSRFGLTNLTTSKTILLGFTGDTDAYVASGAAVTTTDLNNGTPVIVSVGSHNVCTSNLTLAIDTASGNITAGQIRVKVRYVKIPMLADKKY